MSDVEPEKLKVVELRKELSARGLDSKGNKPVLVKRLKQALNKEKGIEVDEADVSVGDLDTSQEDSQNDSHVEAPEKAQVAAEVEAAPEETTNNEVEGTEEAMEATENGTETDLKEEKMEETETKETEENSETENGDGGAQQITKEESTEKPKLEASEEKPGDPPTEEEDDDTLPEEFQTIDETNDEETDDKKDDKDRERRPSKRQRSRSRSPRRNRDSRDRTRRSRSRERRRESPKVVEEEDDSWLQSTTNQLDRYHADLNLRVDEKGLKAHPLTVEGFAFMWAGVRGMFGVKSGKIAYEVKVLDNLKVEHLPSEESKNVLRVGFSVDSSSLQLGEEPLSYGYGGTGKASVDCKFKDYGEKYTAGDVITAYLDLDSEPATIDFSKNGEYLGVCYEVDKDALGEQALFPHILTKNTEFEVNFGELETPWFPLREGFEFLEKVDAENRVRGTAPPAKKEDCEILMMVGLPGSGKTYWANKHSAANPEKRFNVLGTNNIIDKMKVMGLPRKRNYAGRWDSLIEKSMRCLNRLIEIASRKRRNYILDQTNVYASARRRKMQPFEGFQRKAVVVIPSDEDFKSRIAETEKEDGKDVPEKAVLEMKANFTLPEVGSLFDSLEFPELDAEEGGKLIEKYMKEAKALLPPPEKRFRGDRWGSPRGRYDYRGNDYRGRGSYRGDRDRYGGGYGGGRGGYRGGYGGGGYRDGGYRDGGYRDSGYRGGYQGSRGSYNKYDSGGRYDNRNRYDSRSGGSHKSYDSRSYDSRSGGGSWGGRHGSWGGSSGHSSGGWGGQSSWGGQGQWGSSNSGYGSYNQGYGSQSGQGYGSNQWGSSWGGQNYWSGQGGSGGYGQNSSYNQWYGSYK